MSKMRIPAALRGWTYPNTADKGSSMATVNNYWIKFASSKHTTKKFQHEMINNNNTSLTLTSSYGNEAILEKLKRVREGSHYIVVYQDSLTLRKILKKIFSKENLT
jgi:hypothetical protein